jgi:hypothetical protein
MLEPSKTLLERLGKIKYRGGINPKEGKKLRKLTRRKCSKREPRYTRRVK